MGSRKRMYGERHSRLTGYRGRRLLGRGGGVLVGNGSGKEWRGGRRLRDASKLEQHAHVAPAIIRKMYLSFIISVELTPMPNGPAAPEAGQQEVVLLYNTIHLQILAQKRRRARCEHGGGDLDEHRLDAMRDHLGQQDVAPPLPKVG